MKILDRTFREGDTVRVDYDGSRIVFSREAAAEVDA